MFAIGVLVFVSLLISALVTSATLPAWIPGAGQVRLLAVAADFITLTLLFALMFKYLPDVKIAWGDVWLGAAFTAVLFAIGKYLLGWYLGRVSVASAYGPAGSVILFLLWIYYAAQIFLLGAEFTQVCAVHRRKELEPRDYAMWIPGQKKMPA